MKTLLSKLNRETYLLDVNRQLIKPELEEYCCRLIDANTLEVDVAKGIGLNNLFSQLIKKGIQVHGIRNKENRLEALFMDIIAKGRGESQHV